MRQDKLDGLARHAQVELLATASVSFDDRKKPHWSRQRADDRLWLCMPRTLLERVCAAAGVPLPRLLGMGGPGSPRFELQATPELRQFMSDSGMIYPVDVGPIGDHYYVELLDNARLFCRYQTIIGSRQVAVVLDCDLQVFEARAAELLRSAIPKDQLHLVASPVSAPAMASVPDISDQPSSPLTPDSQLLDQLRLLSPEANCLLLPTVQLSRYQDIKRMILKAGGAYHRDGHFQFRAGTDAEELLGRLLDGERINEQQETQFFATPAAEADLVCAKAGPLLGKRVLEPSGGNGALADAAVRAGASDVFVIETWGPNVQVLRDKGYAVAERDFLGVEPEETGLFDVVVMNPPFSRGQDLQHLRHAMSFVEPTGRLTAIVSASFEFQRSRAATTFRELLDVAGVEPHDLPAGTFRESGTGVRTKIIHFDMPELRRRLRECGREAAEFGLRLAQESMASEDLADAVLLSSETAYASQRARA